MLEKLFGRGKPQLVDRDGERYDVSWRVLSRELPGYRGVTLDLSRSGVQLETSAILDVGSEPELKFEFDRGELESFTCKAKVVWSKQDGTNERKFRSGLTFIPTTDDERRQLSRMSTVLQTRSETDLKTLLDQARRIDPELERSYGNISTFRPHHLGEDGVPGAKLADAPPPPPTPSTSPIPVAPSAQASTTPSAPPVAEPQMALPTLPNLGLYIPMSVMLEGYTWNRRTRVLHLGISEGEQVHNLFFPSCQMFQVLEPATDKLIAGLYSTFSSPAVRKVDEGHPAHTHKHYRFVAEDGTGLIDIISAPVKSKLD